MDQPYDHGILAIFFWVGLSEPLLGLLISKIIRRRKQANDTASRTVVYYLVSGPLALFELFGIRKSCVDVPFALLLLWGLAVGISIARVHTRDHDHEVFR